MLSFSLSDSLTREINSFRSGTRIICMPRNTLWVNFLKNLKYTQYTDHIHPQNIHPGMDPSTFPEELKRTGRVFDREIFYLLINFNVHKIVTDRPLCLGYLFYLQTVIEYKESKRDETDYQAHETRANIFATFRYTGGAQIEIYDDFIVIELIEELS